jgi:hypothetical protein
MKYIKKPLVIEAIEWTGLNIGEIKKFMNIETIPWSAIKNEIGIKTLEGVIVASKGDWIIKGVTGEFYPCKPDIFKTSYNKLTNSKQGGRVR